MSLNCLIIMDIFNKARARVQEKLNRLTHNKSTGERLTPFTNALDDLTQTNTTRVLKKRDLVKLRALTAAKTVAQIGTGVATGVLLGKSIFTGTLLGIGTYVVVDILVYDPMQTLSKKVLIIKSK